MRIRREGAPDEELDAALVDAGCELVDDPAVTLLYVVPPVADLDAFTPTVAAWTSEARAAVAAHADVITIVRADGFDSEHAAPAMLAHGMVAATRALAMERDRTGGRANLLVAGTAEPVDVAATVRWLGFAPVTAEIVRLGAARHGRLPV